MTTDESDVSGAHLSIQHQTVTLALSRQTQLSALARVDGADEGALDRAEDGALDGALDSTFGN